MQETDILPGEPDLSIVDRVAWVELDHAYGSAIDVPEQIRSLVSPNADVRRRAIFAFTSNLFHQGSVYSATVAAIPVFQHLLRYEGFKDKAKILELLVAFAIGFPEDVLENVDLAEFIGLPDDDSDPEDHANARDCYLAVGAGVPLYARLLDDADAPVAISAAFTLAFFPAHAFGSCSNLLGVARDESRHAFERSSALIAMSYLGGGAVRVDYLRTLRALIEAEAPGAQESVPLLPATAVYCLLREKRNSDDAGLRAFAEKLAARCIEKGIELPECRFYRGKGNSEDSADVANVDVDELLMPDPQFPWGDLTERIRRHANYRPQGKRKQQVHLSQPQRGPDPDSFEVKPNVFDRENVTAAAQRLHAFFWGLRQSVPVGEFEPFKPHAMLAWDEMIGLLDSETPEDRWAAARVIEQFGPLEEAAIDRLIERLHRGDNNNLGTVIIEQPVSERQCEELCDRLCRREYKESQYHSPRDDYRSIVVKHGTVDQLRRLFAEGEFSERCAAAQELSSRGEIAPAQLLPVLAEALVSGDYALTMSAKWTFAQWPTAQQWFLEAYDSIPQTQRWAIAEAMCGFGADLTEQRGALFARIEAEANPVLAAKLIDAVARFPSPKAPAVERLAGLCGEGSPALVRRAVVRVLGSWIGKGIDGILSGRLQSFADDPSPTVRRAAMDQLAKLDDQSSVFRRSLTDEDPDNRRHAMWHLTRLAALTVEDVAGLLLPNQPDRLSAETLLALFTHGDMRSALEQDTLRVTGENRPLTKSVWGWIGQTRSQT